MTIEPNTIANAEAIIERFGGIRPMAGKINVPVTTIQGWKKRNAIPGNRLEQIQQAAREHNVDIADILSAAPVANENDRQESYVTETARAADIPKFGQAVREAGKSMGAAENFVERRRNPMPNVAYEEIVQKISETERKAVTKSAMINVVFIALVALAMGLLILPQTSLTQNPGAVRIKTLEQELAQLRSDMANVKKEQDAMEDLAARADELQRQAGALAGNTVSPDVAKALADRMASIESHVSDMAGSPLLATLMDNFRSLDASEEGQQQLGGVWGKLSAVVADFTGTPEELNAKLLHARDENPDVQQMFENVPPEDMKAAAMLIGMTQLRSTLARDNVSFEQDLAALKNLAGPDDPALAGALDRLAPHAKAGVLSLAGLATEFKGLAGDIVTASLQGEDISLAEKAQARLNNVLQVEKDGTLVSGTPTQASVFKAQTLLEQGDLTGAIAEMQSLSGSAATVAAPWIDKANATLIAQQLKSQLTQAMDVKAYGRARITASDAPLLGGLPMDTYQHQ